MQVIEFETITQQHSIRLPKGVPDGVMMRVLLLWEPQPETNGDLKELFASVTEGLTDEDLDRPDDRGRGEPEWDT